MKRLFTILTTLALLCAVGCEEQGDDNVNPNDKPNTEQPGEKPDDGSSDTEKPDDAYIALNKEVVTFSPDGESVDIKVYSNYAWELTNNCDWCTTSITSGEASDEGVTVTLTADLTYDDREGTIIFSCGKAKKPLVVSQSFKEAIIADENNVFNVPAEGGNVIINYQTTVECEVIIPEEAKSWISLAPATRALVSESATLTIAENTTYSERSAIVKVVAVGNKSLVAKYTITQDSKPLTFYIEYTSTDGKVVTPYITNVFGAHIIRNEYIDGKGYVWFDAPITSIGNYAFNGCSSLTSITIPDSVTSIGQQAFAYCSSLVSVTIPDSVTSIGKEAFRGCSSLESVTIPDSVTSIGSYAFSGCSSLASVTIGNGVTSIGEEAFSWCSSLTSITIPDSVTSIGDSAFYWCLSLTNVTIGDGVISIGDSAFCNCTSLASITIPDSVTSIGERAFSGCTSLASITIPDSVTEIGEGVFSGCSSLASITIPNSVTSIGEKAFHWCSSLTSITIPDSVTSIGDSAFYNCESLESATIGEGVTWIGDYAFEYCTSLAEVYCKPITPPETPWLILWTWSAFNENASGRKIYVPTESVEAYKNAFGWWEYADSIVGYNFQQ